LDTFLVSVVDMGIFCTQFCIGHGNNFSKLP
jgi:hypothetical protein